MNVVFVVGYGSFFLKIPIPQKMCSPILRNSEVQSFMKIKLRTVYFVGKDISSQLVHALINKMVTKCRSLFVLTERTEQRGYMIKYALLFVFLVSFSFFSSPLSRAREILVSFQRHYLQSMQISFITNLQRLTPEIKEQIDLPLIRIEERANCIPSRKIKKLEYDLPQRNGYAF